MCACFELQNEMTPFQLAARHGPSFLTQSRPLALCRPFVQSVSLGHAFSAARTHHPSSWMALLLAGHLDVVRFLLESGADDKTVDVVRIVLVLVVFVVYSLAQSVCPAILLVACGVGCDSPVGLLPMPRPLAFARSRFRCASTLNSAALACARAPFRSDRASRPHTHTGAVQRAARRGAQRPLGCGGVPGRGAQVRRQRRQQGACHAPLSFNSLVVDFAAFVASGFWWACCWPLPPMLAAASSLARFRSGWPAPMRSLGAAFPSLLR